MRTTTNVPQSFEVELKKGKNVDDTTLIIDFKAPVLAQKHPYLSFPAYPMYGYMMRKNKIDLNARIFGYAKLSEGFDTKNYWKYFLIGNRSTEVGKMFKYDKWASQTYI